MNKLWDFVEAHIGKAIGIPISLNMIEFIMMLMHSLSDGVISHEEMEALMKVGDAASMILLAGVMAYLKFRKPKQ